jgi:hypothetical protein
MRRKNGPKKVKKRRLAHALRRAEQRYGCVLAPEDLVELATAIREHRRSAVFIQRNTLSRTIWHVHSPSFGLTFRVLYHKPSSSIITFLPFPEQEQAAVS